MLRADVCIAFLVDSSGILKCYLALKMVVNDHQLDKQRSQSHDANLQRYCWEICKLREISQSYLCVMGEGKK